MATMYTGTKAKDTNGSKSNRFYTGEGSPGSETQLGNCSEGPGRAGPELRPGLDTNIVLSCTAFPPKG